MKPVRLDGLAEQEAEESYSFYEDREEGLGDRFLSALAATLERIEEFPAACAPLPGTFPLPVRAAQLRRFPFTVVFVELEDRYRVIAVAHTSRKPGYWSERLSDDPDPRSAG